MFEEKGNPSIEMKKKKNPWIKESHALWNLLSRQAVSCTTLGVESKPFGYTKVKVLDLSGREGDLRRD